MTDQLGFQPRVWESEVPPSDVQARHASRTAALVRAADGIFKAPGIKRIAQAVNIPWDAFVDLWLRPEHMPYKTAAAVAWQLHDYRDATGAFPLRPAALAVLSVERDAAADFGRRLTIARDQAWTAALSVGAQYPGALTDQLAQVALSELELLMAVASSHEACRALEEHLSQYVSRFHGRLDLVNHARQSVAVLHGLQPFPDAVLRDRLEDAYETSVESGKNTTEASAWRAWRGVATSVDEWIDDVSAVWDAVVSLTDPGSVSSEPPGSRTSKMQALAWALDAVIAAMEGEEGTAEEEMGDPARSSFDSTNVAEELPSWVLAMVPAIARKWSVRHDPEVHTAFLTRRQDTCASQKTGARGGYGHAEHKRDLLSSAIRVVWAARHTPWVPRWDSREEPVVPAEMPQEVLRHWLARETIKAAVNDLLALPYPLPTDGYGRTRTGRDLWESGEPNADVSESLDDADGDLPSSTPAWDRQAAWDDEDLTSASDRAAEAADELHRLRALASPKVQRLLDTYLELVRLGRPSWAEVARRHGETEGSVRTQVKRLRDRVHRLRDGGPMI